MAELELTLDLEETPRVDPAPLMARLNTDGLRFFTLAEAGDNYMALERLYELVREGVLDTPGHQGGFESLEEFAARIYPSSYLAHADSQFLAANGGEWVGLSSLVVGEGRRASFGLTVVRRSHRRQGIGRLLKLLALQYARALGVRTITTRNNPDNRSMLKLNRSLSFTPCPPPVSEP